MQMRDLEQTDGPLWNYTLSERSGAGFSLWGGLVVPGLEALVTSPHMVKPAPQDISDAAWLKKAAFTDFGAFSISDGECRLVNGPPKNAADCSPAY